MKVILFFIGAFVAVNAGPVPEADPKVDILKEVAKNIVEVTEQLKPEIKEVAKSVKEARGRVSELNEKIPPTVALNEVIFETQKKLDDAKASGKDVEECQAIFEEKAESLTTTLTENAVKHIEASLDLADAAINVVKEELNTIENALKNNLDKELEQCSQDAACRITGEFIKTTERHFQYIDSLKVSVPTIVDNILSFIENKLVNEQSPKAVVEPVDECLKKK